MKSLLVFLCLVPLAAADRPAIPADVRPLLELSRSAPPEFAADALLRIVESGRVENPEVKRDLLEQAFQLSTRARQPVRRIPIPGSTVDTRSWYRGSAMRLGLDALSLECRAIRDLLLLDKGRARELFSNVVKPPLDPLSCEEPLVYDLDDFYQTLQQILSSTFTSTERDKDEHVQFLTMYLDRIAAHAELAPAARVIAALNLTPAQLEVAEGTFLAKLDGMPHDDRSFSVAVGPMEQAVSMLALAVAHQGLSTDGLIRGFRKYLVVNLTGVRCGDNVGAQARSSEAAKVVEWFDTEFHGEAPVIKADEAQPASIDTSAKVEQYWQSAEAKQILTDGKALRFTPQDRPLSAAERNTPEWKQALTDFLTELESWKASAEASEADYFHQKAIAYEALLELTAPGDERDKILSAYVAFLTGSNLQQESPLEWFWHAQDTVQRLRNTGGGDAAKVLAAYKGSGNVVLALYASLEEIAPARPSFAR